MTTQKIIEENSTPGAKALALAEVAGVSWSDKTERLVAAQLSTTFALLAIKEKINEVGYRL